MVKTMYSFPENLRVVLSTAPDRETALQIARPLVESRLAACVNIVPGLTSIYSWQGQMHEEPEHLLIIKTTVERVEELLNELKKHHPYEVPEGLALPVTAAFEAYGAWIVENTRR